MNVISGIDLSRFVPKTADYSAKPNKKINLQYRAKESSSTNQGEGTTNENRSRLMETNKEEDFKKTLGVAFSGTEVQAPQNKNQSQNNVITENKKEADLSSKELVNLKSVEISREENSQIISEKGITVKSLGSTIDSNFDLLAMGFKNLNQKSFIPGIEIENGEVLKSLEDSKKEEFNSSLIKQVVAEKENMEKHVVLQNAANNEKNISGSVVQGFSDSIPKDLGLEKISFVDFSNAKALQENGLKEKTAGDVSIGQKNENLVENKLPEAAVSQLPRIHRLEELVLRAVSMNEIASQDIRRNVIGAVAGPEEVSVGMQNLPNEEEIFSAANRTAEGEKEVFLKDFLRPLNQTTHARVAGESAPQGPGFLKQEPAQVSEPLNVEGVRLETKAPSGLSESAPKESTTKTIGVETVKQISQAVLEANNGGARVLELDLRPAELGRIRLRLIDAGTGSDGRGLRVEIMAIRSDTHAALTQKLGELRDALRGWEVRMSSGPSLDGTRALSQVSETRSAQPGWNDNQQHTPQRDAWDQNREGRSSSRDQAGQEYVEFSDRLSRAFTA